MGTDTTLARALASAFLAGEWTMAGLVAAGHDVVAARPRWMAPLARQVLAAYHRPPADRPRELTAVIVAADPFVRAVERSRRARRPLRVVRWIPAPTRMVRRPWPVPHLDDLADLARLCDVDDARLAWLADTSHVQRRTAPGPLHLYRYRWVPRPGRVPRLLEAPRPGLLRVQRRLLAAVLTGVPAHPAAHGFVPGRGVRTAVAPHAGAAVLLRLDLAAFFASVGAPRVFGLLRAAGYPEPVAHALAGLVTIRTPPAVIAAMPEGGPADQRFAVRRLLASAHLPAGAPTSPALANLVAYRLDARISGYARTAGLAYTRYADDLILSGGPAVRRTARRVVRAVDRIAVAEGFTVNASKTRVRGRSQRQEVLGIVVNERPTVRRDEYDRLRALLHNAARTGAAAQNRDGHADFRAHLTGRVSWVASLDPGRGATLRAMLDRIDWSR